MDILMLIWIILSVILIVVFVVWFFMTDWRCSKIKVLISDSLLILLSIAVLLIGLQVRSDVLEKNRTIRKQEILEQIEEESILDKNRK